MIVVSPIEPLRGTRYRKIVDGMLPAGSGSWLTDHMGRDRKARPEETVFPMAYLVEQDANTHLRPHFHIADQFQVVIAGGGLLGKHPIGPLSVHYTDACTPYGPIEAGAEGVHYFTLRNAWDGGARYLPESRAQLGARTRARRSAIAGPVPVCSDAALAKITQVSWKPLLDTADDGLAAWLAAIPSAGKLEGPAPAKGNGQFWIVTAGSAVRDGTDLAVQSCVFVSGDEQPLSLAAGPRGAEVLVLQYPKHP